MSTAAAGLVSFFASGFFASAGFALASAAAVLEAAGLVAVSVGLAGVVVFFPASPSAFASTSFLPPVMGFLGSLGGCLGALSSADLSFSPDYFSGGGLSFLIAAFTMSTESSSDLVNKSVKRATSYSRSSLSFFVIFLRAFSLSA